MNQTERITKRLDLLITVSVTGFWAWAVDHGHSVLAYTVVGLMTIETIRIVLKERG